MAHATRYQSERPNGWIHQVSPGLTEVRLCVAATTQFGQHISLAYSSSKQLPLRSVAPTRMSYEKPGFWTIKLKSVATDLYYKYLLQHEQFSSEPVWESGRDRHLNFSSLSTLTSFALVRDVWRVKTDPIWSIFSTTAFTHVLFCVNPIVGKRHYEAMENASFAEALIHPPGAFVVIFRVFVERISKGDCVFVVGDCAELGSNDPSNAIHLTDTFTPIWQVSVPFLGPNNHIKYRFFIRSHDSIILDDALQRELTFNQFDQSFLVSKPGNVPVVYAPFERPFCFKRSWIGAGIVFPVFSIRSRRSCGIGEFSDLIHVVNFCKATGHQILQLLPVHHTILEEGICDDNPYSIISGFALHPQYLNIDELGTLPDVLRQEYESERNRLNRCNSIASVEVLKVKNRFIREMFKLHRNEFLKSTDFKIFYEDNRHWLVPYALFLFLMHVNGTSQFSQWGVHSLFSFKTTVAFSESDSFLCDHLALSYYTQFHLHKQLKQATDYATINGIVLKGDIPVGVNRFSVDTWVYPHFFRLDMQAGAPPDSPAQNGENYFFPPHNWEVMRHDNYTWWRSRINHMAKYFQALHIRHSHSLVRFWEFPRSFRSPLFGRFYPCHAISRQELDCLGLWDIDRYTKPYINDGILQKHFQADWWKVKDRFFEPLHDNRLQFKTMFDSEKKIENFFKLVPSAPEYEQQLSTKTMSSLLSLFNNTCLLRDEKDENKFHPHFSMQSTSSYAELPSEDWKRALSSLQKDYISRQDELWKRDGSARFSIFRDAGDMLIFCGDLGRFTAPLAFVMDETCSLGMQCVSLEDTEFCIPSEYKYECVATTSSPVTNTLRAWWEEIPAKVRKKYWTQVLHQDESLTIPSECTAEIVEKIIAKQLHSPAMWAIFPIQDLLRIDDGQYCLQYENEERTNASSDPSHIWKFRIRTDIETLLENKNLVQKLGQLNQKAGRGSIY